MSCGSSDGARGATTFEGFIQEVIAGSVGGRLSMADFPQVVAHYTDGRMLKGTTQDFNPNRPSFHIKPVGGGPAVEVRCALLKAIFFV